MSRVIHSLSYFSLFIVVFELTDLRDEEEGRGESGNTVVLFITLFSLSFFLALFYFTWWKQDGGGFVCWSTPLIHWIWYLEHETKYNAGEILVQIIPRMCGLIAAYFT